VCLFMYVCVACVRKGHDEQAREEVKDGERARESLLENESESVCACECTTERDFKRENMCVCLCMYVHTFAHISSISPTHSMDR